jgi:antitoxin HicB
MRPPRVYHKLPDGEGWVWVYLPPSVEFACMLRRLRDLRGLAEEGVAEMAGLTAEAYERLEDPSKSNPTLKTIQKLMQALHARFDLNIFAYDPPDESPES